MTDFSTDKHNNEHGTGVWTLQTSVGGAKEAQFFWLSNIRLKLSEEDEEREEEANIMKSSALLLTENNCIASVSS